MSDRHLVETNRASLQIIQRLQADVRSLKARAKLAGTGKEILGGVDPLEYTANDDGEVLLAGTTIERGKWLLIGRTDWRARHDSTVDAFTGLEEAQLRIVTHPVEDPSILTDRDVARWSPQGTEVTLAAATRYAEQSFSLNAFVRLDDRVRVELRAAMTNTSALISQWLRMKLICVPL